MAHSARQNDSFCATKWPILKCKMSHFASHVFVKKLQVACFQCFRRLAYFARTRPSDFYFRMLPFSEAKIELFVSFFQIFTKAVVVRFRVTLPLGGCSSSLERRIMFAFFWDEASRKTNGMRVGLKKLIDIVHCLYKGVFIIEIIRLTRYEEERFSIARVGRRLRNGSSCPVSADDRRGEPSD